VDAEGEYATALADDFVTQTLKGPNSNLA